jgi:thioredoxin-like negative regulator of GroEL
VAEAQFRLEPDSAESSLVLARQLRLIGDRNRARELLSALIERERRSPFISNLQWVRLAQELYEAGDATLAQEALVEATAREPNNPDLRKLSATHALAQKLGRPISLEATQEDQPKTIRIGFFSRLRKIFTR